MNRLVRVGIVGASSLMGRELADVLGSSALGAGEVALLDEEAVSGQVTAMGDEAAVIGRIDAGSFEGMDFCFFAGRAEETRKHWRAATKAGVSVIDLSGALRGEAGVAGLSPWVREAVASGSVRSGLDLGTTAVVPAHIVAAVLGLVAARWARLGLTEIGATVLEPASERGQAGMDEMHQQTVNLLSFQSLPRAEFDAQVAFNLLPELGGDARMKMSGITARILEEYAAFSGVGRDDVLPPLMLQMVHAPVFHGYGFSVLMDFDRSVTAAEMERALPGAHVDLVSEDSDPPSNLSAAGQSEVLVRVARGSGRRMWAWMAGDNLRLTALHAIACALEMKALRTGGLVQ